MYSESDFRDIEDFPGYKINPFGDIVGKRFNRKLKLIKNLHGYYQVNLYKNNKMYCIKVHHLVLETFIGDRQIGQVCCHKDGNKLNNHIENLRWGTMKENNLDKAKHGQIKRGEDVPNSKLTSGEVIEMRKDKQLGLSYKEMSSKYKVSIITVNRVVNRKSWKHL